MGLLEYKAVLSLLKTDGCVVLLYNSSWKFLQLAGGQSMSGQPVRYGKGGRYGTSIKYKITPVGVPLLQPAGRHAMVGQPSSLRPHCLQLQPSCSVPSTLVLCYAELHATEP